MRTLINLVESTQKGGYIVLSKGRVLNGTEVGTGHWDGTESYTEFWSAAFFEKKPTLSGVEHADEMLVQSDSRAGKSRETALATARKKKPDAEVIEVD